jgi:hypothetical protein
VTALTALLTWFGLSAVAAPVIGRCLFGREQLPRPADADRLPLAPVVP